MQKHDLPDQPVTEEPRDSQWTPPPPPALEGRLWFMLIIERFGFRIAFALTITVIASLYIIGDQVPREDKALSSVAAEEPDTIIVAGVPLSITTDPVHAVIFVDGDYVGVSPLRDVAMTEGRHLISVLKPDYAQLDTVVTLNEASASLQLTLREAEAPLLDEADQTDQQQTMPSPDPDEISAETDQAAIEEKPVAAIDESVTAADEPDADDESGADDEGAEPVVQVGELQINSEPSGVSVLVAGEEVGVTPLLLSEVQVGPQQITLRLDGYQDLTTIAYVLAQQQSTVNRQLKQLLGTLKILVKPWGIIYIDGELHKEESDIWYTTKLMSGYHRVRVEHPSLGNWEQVVAVPTGEEHSITIDFNKSNSGGQ